VPDSVGTRAKWGVLTPAANTVIEHDFSVMRPHGITFHVGRMYATPLLDSNEAFQRFNREILESMGTALRDILEVDPDYIILGISAPGWIGGVQGDRDLKQRLEQESRRKVTTAPTACVEALHQFQVKRIAVLSPYQPLGDARVTGYLTDAGFEVVAVKSLRCPTPIAIAKLTDRELVPAIRELDSSRVEAILQVGANLSMLRLADAAERWLGKPVIALTAATLWHALRANQFVDRFEGFGRILRDF
jgi:maleate isomerase